MAAMVAKGVGKHVVKNSTGGLLSKKKDDPFHYTAEARDKDGKLMLKNGKPVMVTGPKDKEYYMGLGIPEKDAKRLATIKWRARHLDGSHKFMGVRFGLSGVIGLIPMFGDGIDGLLALLVVKSCSKVSDGLDPSVRNKMIMNVVIDIMIGLTPFLGDFADILYRCNTKNAQLLEDMLKKRVAKAIEEAEREGRLGRPLGHNRAGFDGYYSDQSGPGMPPKYTTEYQAPQEGARSRPTALETARTKSGGWMNGFGSHGGRDKSAVTRHDNPPARPPRPEGSLLQNDRR